MATYMRNSVFVSCLMFFVIGSLNAQKADVAAICGKARNPAFCNNFMKGKSGDAKALAQIALTAAQASATAASAKVQSLATSAATPALKAKYNSCVGQYKDAISSLNEAKGSLSDGQGLNMKVSAAMTGAGCHNEGDFQNICGIVLVLSNMM